MTRPLLDDAFAHHVWATIRIIDACIALSPALMDASAPGTYGSILDTLRHLVAADDSYLYVLSGGRTERVDAEELDLAGLRALMVTHGSAWAEVLRGDIDPDAILIRTRDDGSRSEAPAGVRLAQVVHHGTDHRSQICTALTAAGVTPPDIDVWDFAYEQGRLVEVPAPS
jgi:uncharacterized damage-inducible protein DinB